MTRVVLFNFVDGTISAWVKVPNGVAHRVARIDVNASEMRAVEYEMGTIERFRLNPTGRREVEVERGDAA